MCLIYKSSSYPLFVYIMVFGSTPVSCMRCVCHDLGMRGQLSLAFTHMHSPHQCPVLG